MGNRGGQGRTGEDRPTAGTSAGGTITVVARDITTGALIPEFKFIVNENNVGDPQVDLPEEQRDPARFPSLKPAASHSPVVAAGEASPGSPGAVTVPDGSYLVSVLAPGYKMGGTWVTVAGSPVTAEAW
ncbi:MAG: hypothetical protein QME93_08535, partial [Bacillota bacterium]|nr:hypothetical protein [Bacillota bacterium]